MTVWRYMRVSTTMSAAQSHPARASTVSWASSARRVR